MGQYQYNHNLVNYSRSNRKNQTESEKLLWLHLRKSIQGYKFRRQFPIGNFILDFYCIRKKLAIELDGGQHKGNRSYDTYRSKKLAERGIIVMRFWDSEVLSNTEGVLEKIILELNK